MFAQCPVIAEAGVNHNGDVQLAHKMIDVAADAGADFIKFQTFKASDLATHNAEKAEYQKAATSESQFDMLHRLELPPDAWQQLAEHAQSSGIAFLSTPFDLEAIEILARLHLSCIKIPSGEITDLPYLRAIAGHPWKIILSTGMSTMQEIEDALQILEKAGKPRSAITLLHCTSQYPAPVDQINLRAMEVMRDRFSACAGIGYSDHTEGIAISLAAAARGATLLEKHFTLDRNLPGPDHKASIEPDELRMLVQGVHNICAALGEPCKKVMQTEHDTRAVARKSLVATRNIRRGEKFSAENLTAKRPGTGLSPMLWDTVITQYAARDIMQDQLLQNADIMPEK